MLDAYEGIFKGFNWEYIFCAFKYANSSAPVGNRDVELTLSDSREPPWIPSLFLSAEIICISAVLPPEVDSWGGCRRYREKMSGQTLTDRIAAAQYQLTGSDVARAVCKATTHEVMAPKKKHLDCKWDILNSPSFLRPGAVQFSTTVQWHNNEAVFTVQLAQRSALCMVCTQWGCLLPVAIL